SRLLHRTSRITAATPTVSSRQLPSTGNIIAFREVGGLHHTPRASGHRSLQRTPACRGTADSSPLNSQNGKSPLPGGQARRNKLLVSWGPLVIAAPLQGSLLAPLRCAAPCQSRSRFKIPTPFASCFRTLRSVALSRGSP